MLPQRRKPEPALMPLNCAVIDTARAISRLVISGCASDGEPEERYTYGEARQRVKKQEPGQVVVAELVRERLAHSAIGIPVLSKMENGRAATREQFPPSGLFAAAGSHEPDQPFLTAFFER